MIPTFSSTIRRREMDAVLTCMVDEKIGPGEMNARFISLIKEFFHCDGAVALRSPEMALRYVLKALEIEPKSKIMISALAPSWHITCLESLDMEPVVLDVDEMTALVTVEGISKGIENGAKLLLLHETFGALPDMDAVLSLGIPVIEDISSSCSSMLGERAASSFGVFTIMGLEERDIITAGGGAVVMAPKRREWLMLKKWTDSAPSTELLPDLNCALGWVELKEFTKNESSRKELYVLYQKACMSGRHKMIARNIEADFAVPSFPLIIESSFNDAKQYAAKKDIEVKLAFEKSVMALREDELSSSCLKAKSLFLRTTLFPLYPRLTQTQATKVVKVLGSLP